MKKCLLLILLLFFSLSLISAGENNLESLGTFKQNHNVTIKQVCADATYINVSIAYPNSTVAVNNAAMTKDGSAFYYYFNNTSDFGRYDVFGVSDGCTKTYATYFKISYYGKELSQSQALVYIGLLGILIFILFVTFFGIGFLPNGNQRDEEGRIMSISWLKYLRMPLWLTCYFMFVGIVYLSSNLAYAFLEEQLFASFLFNIFRILFAVSPVIIIILMVSFFITFFNDRQFQTLLNRGIYPQHRL